MYPDPLRELTALPGPHSWIKGKGKKMWGNTGGKEGEIGGDPIHYF